MSHNTIILSFDTTGRQDSIAIKVNDQIETRLLPQGGSGLQSAILVPELHRLLCDYNLTFQDITTLCTLTGPGSFTGIRIGLATAQGFKIALGLEVFSPSALDLLSQLTGLPAALDSLRGDYFVKDGDEILILTQLELKDRLNQRPIASLSPIEGIETVVLDKSMAELLIKHYESCQNRQIHQSLAPFYIRNPEFVKKKPVP